MEYDESNNKTLNNIQYIEKDHRVHEAQHGHKRKRKLVDVNLDECTLYIVD